MKRIADYTADDWYREYTLDEWFEEFASTPEQVGDIKMFGPQAVIDWAKDNPLRLLSYDDESNMITFELVGAPGSRISYSCTHWEEEKR